MPKKPTSFRLSEPALALLLALSKKLGLSQAAVVEVALRKFAKDQGVPVPASGASVPVDISGVPVPRGEREP